MLHFLIGLALCIWIAERVAHYCSEWRWRRQQRRYVRWLQGEDIRSGLPPWVTLSPPPPQPRARAPQRHLRHRRAVRRVRWCVAGNRPPLRRLWRLHQRVGLERTDRKIWL